MTTNEKSFIIALMQEYVKIHKYIEVYEGKLNELERRPSIKNKGDLKDLELKIKTEVERLAVFRNVELEFWGAIEEKYGPGEFDPNTLEYRVKSHATRE